MYKQYKRLWWALGAFIILSPLGLIATGTAFGEWGVDQLKEEVGFIPAGLVKLADIWQHVLLPDYGIPGFDATFVQSAIGYIISAIVGVVLVVGVMSLFSRIIKEE